MPDQNDPGYNPSYSEGEGLGSLAFGGAKYLLNMPQRAAQARLDNRQQQIAGGFLDPDRESPEARAQASADTAMVGQPAAANIPLIGRFFNTGAQGVEQQNLRPTVGAEQGQVERTLVGGAEAGTNRPLILYKAANDPKMDSATFHRLYSYSKGLDPDVTQASESNAALQAFQNPNATNPDGSPNYANVNRNFIQLSAPTAPEKTFPRLAPSYKTPEEAALSKRGVPPALATPDEQTQAMQDVTDLNAQRAAANEAAKGGAQLITGKPPTTDTRNALSDTLSMVKQADQTKDALAKATTAGKLTESVPTILGALGFPTEAQNTIRDLIQRGVKDPEARSAAAHFMGLQLRGMHGQFASRLNSAEANKWETMTGTLAQNLLDPSMGPTNLDAIRDFAKNKGQAVIREAVAGGERIDPSLAAEFDLAPSELATGRDIGGVAGGGARGAIGKPPPPPQAPPGQMMVKGPSGSVKPALDTDMNRKWVRLHAKQGWSLQ
jgi:hypothetical protein